MNGKGDRNRTRDHANYRENYMRIFGRQAEISDEAVGAEGREEDDPRDGEHPGETS